MKSKFLRKLKDWNENAQAHGKNMQSWIFIKFDFILMHRRGEYRGGRGDIRPPWDFEAKNVPNLINVIVNDKFRIRNL